MGKCVIYLLSTRRLFRVLSVIFFWLNYFVVREMYFLWLKYTCIYWDLLYGPKWGPPGACSKCFGEANPVWGTEGGTGIGGGNCLVASFGFPNAHGDYLLACSIKLLYISWELFDLEFWGNGIVEPAVFFNLVLCIVGRPSLHFSKWIFGNTSLVSWSVQTALYSFNLAWNPWRVSNTPVHTKLLNLVN